MEKFYKLLGDLRLKLFGKKKKETIGNTGLEKSPPDIIQEIEDLLYDECFEINGYTNCSLYYSNGHWYKSNSKGKFVYLGKDITFEGENFTA